MEDLIFYIAVGSAFVLGVSMVYAAATETSYTEKFIDSINDFNNKKYKAK